MVNTKKESNKKENDEEDPPVDMTIRIGGRLVEPDVGVADGSKPTKMELEFQEFLDTYVHDNIPVEPPEGMRTRERVLDRMRVLCKEWVRSVCVEKGLPPDVVESSGGELFTSGSYRLGVNEPGADIDTILVAPNMCHRNDFFGTANVSESNPNRDPNSLAERIRNHPDVTNFVPVEGATVPILTFDWEGINIDLLFARINSNSVPANFDIDNDAVLDGVDNATEKSLNGPRVTNMISELMNGTEERYQRFLTVVRCVRKWAKARGLYSNKMGYWGGVNINMGVAFVIQLYPNASAAMLLRRFFLVFSTWLWKNPVRLTKSHDAGYGLTVWSQQALQPKVAPMITPAYPAMNSTLSVSRQTLQILQLEFDRGYRIANQLWSKFEQIEKEKKKLEEQKQQLGAQDQEQKQEIDMKKQELDEKKNEIDWKPLFEPSDFFIAYPHYLSLCIVGPTQSDAQAWAGFVESRLRKLVSDLLSRSLPIKRIQLWPKKLEACVADKGAILTLAQRQNSITYFIGFQVDKLRMRGQELNVEDPLRKFRDVDLSRYQPLLPGMDVLVKSFGVKELPKMCFEGIYEGGKEEAMKKRRRLRDADPMRRKRRHEQRLEELKAKLAEEQRKKDGGPEKKRKREEVEAEEEIANALKQENEADSPEPANEPGETEESNLLQSALNTMQDAADVKTREEAEDDRRKLLAGEIVDEGDDANVSDEDDYGYNVDRGRHSILNRPNRNKDKRSLEVDEEDAAMLRKLGYSINTDDESKILGANMLPPWRADGNEITDEDEPLRVNFKFLEKFDIVELDARGHIIDKGDEDFMPSEAWIGRKAGFEFKLGERGQGYYRTGAKVVVPSNTAY